MFRNYIHIAWRNLIKNKTQSMILLGGLTVGMATCILLLQYVSFQLSFDTFHGKSANIYRVINERFQNGQSIQKGTITYPMVAPSLKEDIPAVVNATRMAYNGDIIISKDDKVEKLGTNFWVDEHFFEIFDFPMLALESDQIFKNVNEVVIPHRIADLFFSDINKDYKSVLGRSVFLDRFDNPFKIVGVLDDIPQNSSYDFDLLVSYPTLVSFMGDNADKSKTNSDFHHFVELMPGTDVKQLEDDLEDFSSRHFNGTEASGSEEVFSLQPLEEAHLNSNGLEYEVGSTANGNSVWGLLIIAFFILVIAWINYLNLSSVRAIERSREVGVRKVVGASRGQLMMQFLSEAVLANILSFMAAISMVQLISPWFTKMLSLDEGTLSLWQNSNLNIYLVLTMFGLILAGILLSGLYPAWLMSSSHVSSVLKGVFKRNLGGNNLRRVLVVSQFSLSMLLIAGTLIVSRQIRFLNEKDLGFIIDQVLVIDGPELEGFDSSFIERINTFKSEVRQIPGVTSASTSNRIPGDRMGRVFQVRNAQQPDHGTFMSSFLSVDFDYADTYDLRPLAGRFFRAEDHHVDMANIDKIVLNENAVELFGFTSPEMAVGQHLNFFNKNWQVVGVLPDFHQLSFHYAIEPIIFTPFYGTGNYISIKVEADNVRSVVSAVEEKYHAVFPGNTFVYDFADASFKSSYEGDQVFGKVLSLFTIITIIIACLGLFGLASYTTYLKTKEIGVRKVLGASPISIVRMLSMDYLRLIFFAFIISIPVALYVSNLWLQEFAYHSPVGWGVFIVVGFASILAAMMAVMYQSISAALANPAESLRTD